MGIRESQMTDLKDVPARATHIAHNISKTLQKYFEYLIAMATISLG